MISQFKNLLLRPFVRKSVLFQVGSVGAMIVQAGAGVLLARLLGPEEFGRYAIVMSLAAVASVFLGAGAADAMAPVLSRARHRDDTKEMNNALLFLGKFVTITAAAVVVLGFVVLPLIATELYSDTAIGWYALMVLAAAGISTLLFAPTQLVLQVFGRIRRLSLLTFTDQAVRQLFVVMLVLGGFGVFGAASGHLIGVVFVAIIAGVFWHGLRRLQGTLPSAATFLLKWPHKGRSHIAPTLWVLADRNLAMLYGAAPVAIAALFLTNTDVSYFKIALGWITLVLGVLTPVSVLLNTELARIQVQQPERLRRQFAKVSLGAIGVSAVVTGIAALLARPVFALLYGAQYAPAVSYVYWLIPFGALFGLGIALGPMWRALNKVKISVAINLVVLGISVPLGMLALSAWGILGGVAMVTLWYTASHTASFWYLMRQLGRAGNIRSSTV